MEYRKKQCILLASKAITSQVERSKWKTILNIHCAFSYFLDDTPETCIYSNWSPWSACSSSTCEKGKRMRQRMLKAQLDLSVPCPDTQDFQPCMGPGCSDEGSQEEGVEENSL